MPKLEDIERFKVTLNSLGGEPDILREKGEEIEDPGLPEESMLSELSDLFETPSETPPPEEETAEETDSTGQSFEEEQIEEGLPEELSLEGLFGEEPSLEESSEKEPTEEEEYTGGETEERTEEEGEKLPDLDFESLFGEERKKEEGKEEEEEGFDFDMDEFEGVDFESTLGDIEGLGEIETPAEKEEEEGEGEEEKEAEFSPQESAQPTEEEAKEEKGEGAEEEEMGFSLEDQFEEVGEGGEEDFVLDEFTLPEFGGFEEEEKKEEIPGVEETLKGLGAELGEELTPGEVGIEVPEVGEEAEEVEAGIQLTREQFDRFKKTLNSLPINLKLAVEELITSGKAKGEKLKRLINILVAGASPREIASLVADITGKRIKIPKVYERRAGIQFEEEKKTFAYAFRENILPVAISVFLTLAVLSVFSFLGYWFVYRPIHAISLYKRGYAYIENNQYKTANRDFNTARKIWNLKSWYYRYAEAYIGKRQYILAEEKYQQLLDSFPGDKKGLLDYARLESKYLANYEKADKLLDEILNERNNDYDALLAKGDNYMEWAKEDPSKYEKARFNYALILQTYGDIRVVLFRMLRYFIRTDQGAEAERLFRILDADKKAKVDPGVYAELAGYLIDKGKRNPKKLELVPDILDRAMKEAMKMPEIHYQWARYYEEVEKPGEEMKALKYVLYLLKDKQPTTTEVLKMKIDSYNRLGEIYYNRKEIITAEENFQKAVNLAEDSLKRKILKPNKLFGSAFNNLGNIYYYIDDNLDEAEIFFNKAEDNFYKTPTIDYKLGYISYMKKKYRDALLRFASVGVELPNNWNTMYAMGNSLFLREDYSAAQGYYLDLLEKLQNKRDEIQFLQPRTNPEHLALIKYFIRVYNNLGVTLYKLSLRTGDKKKFSEGLVDLTHSSEYYDILTRNQITMERSAAKSLSYLNMNGLLHPQSGFEPQIYWRIPKDPSQLNF